MSTVYINDLYDDEYCGVCGHAEEWPWHETNGGHCEDGTYHALHPFFAYNAAAEA